MTRPCRWTWRAARSSVAWRSRRAVGPAREEIGYINYYGTDALNDAVEARCVRRVFERGDRVPDPHEIDDRPPAGGERRGRRSLRHWLPREIMPPTINLHTGSCVRPRFRPERSAPRRDPGRACNCRGLIEEQRAVLGRAIDRHAYTPGACLVRWCMVLGAMVLVRRCQVWWCALVPVRGATAVRRTSTAAPHSHLALCTCTARVRACECMLDLIIAGAGPPDRFGAGRRAGRRACCRRSRAFPREKLRRHAESRRDALSPSVTGGPPAAARRSRVRVTAAPQRRARYAGTSAIGSPAAISTAGCRWHATPRARISRPAGGPARAGR